MTNLDHSGHPHQRNSSCFPLWPTISAMHRRLVACRLVDPDTFCMEASDGTVWLHRIGRDEKGSPRIERIDRWLNKVQTAIRHPPWQ